MRIKIIASMFLVLMLSGCATSPAGRQNGHYNQSNTFYDEQRELIDYHYRYDVLGISMDALDYPEAVEFD